MPKPSHPWDRRHGAVRPQPFERLLLTCIADLAARDDGGSPCPLAATHGSARRGLSLKLRAEARKPSALTRQILAALITRRWRCVSGLLSRVTGLRHAAAGHALEFLLIELRGYIVVWPHALVSRAHSTRRMMHTRGDMARVVTVHRGVLHLRSMARPRVTSFPRRMRLRRSGLTGRRLV
jgi:hypothetical protein